MGLIISFAVGYLTGALFMLFLYERFRVTPIKEDKNEYHPTIGEKNEKPTNIGFYS